MNFGKAGVLGYDLQHADGKGGTVCDQYKIADIDDLSGKWVDFVQHAKWTGNTDGFLTLWMKVGGGGWRKVIDYHGRTWWNDEDAGPYFKMGAYTGDPGWKGATRVIYTDEYRLGDAGSTFAEVAPPAPAHLRRNRTPRPPAHPDRARARQRTRTGASI